MESYIQVANCFVIAFSINASDMSSKKGPPTFLIFVYHYFKIEIFSLFDLKFVTLTKTNIIFQSQWYDNCCHEILPDGKNG